MARRSLVTNTSKVFLLVLSGGLLVRLAYVLQSARADPMFFDPTMDALFHHQWAQAIIRGGWLAEMPFFRAPLYPYFLALVYKVFGVNLLVPRLVQALIGSASCGMVYLLGLELFDRRAALAAGVAATVYPLLVYFDGELLIPTLLIFMLLVGMLLLYKCERRDRYWFAPGALWGLASITQPNVLAFVGLTPIWFWLTYRRGMWRRVVPFGLALIAVILPVAVRNLVVSGEFIPIAWQAGTNFVIGNNPDSDGMTAVVPGTRKDWWGGFYDVRRIAEEAAGRRLRYSEVDRFWLGQGLRFWKESPGKALLLLLRKCYLFFAGHEIPNNRDTYFFSRFTFLKFLLFRLPMLQFPFGLLVPLAGVGMLFARKQWRRHLPVYLFIAGYSVSYIVFFVTDRYRLPLVPPLLLFASSAAFALYRAVRSGRGWVLPAVLFAGLTLFFNSNLARVPGANPA